MSFVPREGPSRRREALCWGSGRRGCVPLASVVDGLRLVWGAASGGICGSSAKVLLFQNDLLFLKVTSQLHHLSIKCAIHVLHVNKFNPHCLHRRPADEVRRDTTCAGGPEPGHLEGQVWGKQNHVLQKWPHRRPRGCGFSPLQGLQGSQLPRGLCPVVPQQPLDLQLPPPLGRRGPWAAGQ